MFILQIGVLRTGRGVRAMQPQDDHQRAKVRIPDDQSGPVQKRKGQPQSQTEQVGELEEDQGDYL